MADGKEKATEKSETVEELKKQLAVSNNEGARLAQELIQTRTEKEMVLDYNKTFVGEAVHWKAYAATLERVIAELSPKN